MVLGWCPRRGISSRRVFSQRSDLTVTFLPNIKQSICARYLTSGGFLRELSSHLGELYSAADESEFDPRLKEAVEHGKIYFTFLSADGEGDYGENLLVIDADGDVDHGVAWTDESFNSLSEDIEEPFQKEIIDGLDASAVQSVFEEEDKETTCREADESDLTASVVKSALDNADDAWNMKLDDVRPRKSDGKGSELSWSSRQARERTWIELAKLLLRQAENLFEDGEVAGHDRHNEWVAALRLGVSNFEMKRQTSLWQQSIIQSCQPWHDIRTSFTKNY